jgi:hypothetical protein
VGFPKGSPYGARGNAPARLPDFIQFHAWVNGKKVQFQEEDGRWLAAQVQFPDRRSTVIRVVYEANYYRGSHASYIIGTGGPWKDSIKRTAFTVDGSAIGGTKNFSASFFPPVYNRELSAKLRKLRSDKAIRIEVDDLEPESDVRLEVGVSLRRNEALMSRQVP